MCFIKIFPILLSALGGGMMVFSNYDDSPGGSLLGLVMILLAIYLSVKNFYRVIIKNIYQNLLFCRKK